MYPLPINTIFLSLQQTLMNSKILQRPFHLLARGPRIIITATHMNCQLSSVMFVLVRPRTTIFGRYHGINKHFLARKFLSVQRNVIYIVFKFSNYCYLQDLFQPNEVSLVSSIYAASFSHATILRHAH